MTCKNHPSIEAVDRCVGCAEPFCANCLVLVQGQKYCASCKVMSVKGPPIVVTEEGDVPCEEANEALKYAIISIFCFGIILGPMAISKGMEARRLIRDDPDLSGSGKANAAIIIGIVVIIFWVLGMAARVKGIGG